MVKKRLLAALILVAILGVSLAFFAEECRAQGQDYMERTGIEGLFAGKRDADGRGPNRWQTIVGLVAFPVSFIVIKWL